MTTEEKWDEARDLLLRASHDIAALRRTIQQLAPKAEAFDALSTVIGMLPRQGHGNVPDVAWQIDRFLAQTGPVLDPVNVPAEDVGGSV